MIGKPTYEELERLVEERTYELEESNKQLKQKVKECIQGTELIQLERNLSISLSSTYDLMDGLHISLEVGLQVSGMDCGGIYLFDKTNGDLNLIVHQGLTVEFVRSVSHYDKDSENTIYVKKGKPAYTLRKDLNVSMTPVERREGVQAFITLPLLDEGEVIGCMNLASHTIGEIPSSVRVAVETVAAQIGSAIARLKARAALQESEEHLRSLMESATNFAVYRLVSDEKTPHKLRVKFISPSAKDILGIPEPMKFESWFEKIHPDDVGRMTEANRQAFETRRFNEEYRTYNGKKGEWRWIHAISNGGVNKKSWNRYVNGILIDITKRKLSEEALKAKDKELETKASKLKEINTALNVLLEKRKIDKIELEEKILLNVESLIKPYLDKLQQGNLDERKKNILNIIQTNLDEIISPFTHDMSSRHYNLTPKEIQITNFVRQGYTNKEIADILVLSTKTIEFHRDNIRKKLGIKNKKINLRAYLSPIN